MALVVFQSESVQEATRHNQLYEHNLLIREMAQLKTGQYEGTRLGKILLDGMHLCFGDHVLKLSLEMHPRHRN
jgi:hypothetical protein